MKSPVISHRNPTRTNSDNSSSTSAVPVWSSPSVAYHHLYPNSYSPQQTPFFYPNDPTIYGGNYRHQDMELLPPTAMYGRTSEEFLHGWNNPVNANHHHHHHHQNLKIFN